MSDRKCARTFGCVEASEVSGSVDDDALHGHVESEVKPLDAIGFEDFGDAVSKAGEFPLRGTLADVGGESCPGEVERIHEAEGRCTSGAAGREITGEVPPELCLLVHAAEEDLLVLVFESKVKGLRGEVPNDVGQVAPPE